jgi:hypothetical protein
VASDSGSSAPEALPSRNHATLPNPYTRPSLSRLVGGGFEASLAMKENVDFLLTPALLSQEAVSAGVIMTYPSE